MSSRRRDSDPESFVSNYVDWGDDRLRGRQKPLDQALSTQRGMKARSGLDDSAKTFTNRSAAAATRIDDETLSPKKRKSALDTKTKSDKDLRTVGHLLANPDVQDRPTTVNSIAGNFSTQFEGAVQKGISRGGEVAGTGWYYEHRRQQESALGPDHGLSDRQVTAMGGKLSSGKTPDDEQASMAGINDLRKMGSETINGRSVESHTSEEIGQQASAAAAWSHHEEHPTRASQPGVPKPDASPEVYSALRRSGRAHEDNISVATSIARGEITPREGFGEGTPKTSAYAEMQARSNPGSVEETDYRNIAAHYRDTVAGTQSRDQGMMVFSQNEGEGRSHSLAPDTPTAIDTWMIAAGSGQPLAAKHPDTGRTYSPAKRLVDKDFPLSPSDNTKEELGTKGTDTSVTSDAVVSAQHNEAIHKVTSGIGAISHDQFGQDVHVPSSLVQETVWTGARREAGWDPAHNANVRQETKDAAGKVKAEKKTAGVLAKTPRLFKG